MRRIRIGRLLSVSMISLGLTACGAGNIASVPAIPATPAQTPTPPITLTGNWLLTGSRVPATYPTLSTSLFVQGNTITGAEVFSAQCTSAGVIDTFGASGFPLNGAIANDGTFQASTGTLGHSTSGTFSVSITGNSPLPAAPYLWTGTYSLVFTPGTSGISCGIAQTGNFVASAIAPLTGTYVGVPANPGPGPGPFGAGAAVSVQIAQGMPKLVAEGSTSSYLIPLTASLSVANSPCALSVSTTNSPVPGSIHGDSFNIVFPVPGSPGGGLSGTLNDTTANAFSGDLTSLAIANGCSGSLAFYNFTRK